jgi:hypothetical protein
MPIRHLRVQEAPWTCTVAGVRTLLAWAGVERDEAEILAEIGDPPLSLQRARTFGDVYRLDFDHPRSIEILIAYVEAGWCLAEVVCQPATHNAGKLRSPHPPMGRGHHILVLIGHAGGMLTYMDPYFLPDGQPLKVSVRDFVADWWTGDLLVPHVTPRQLKQ